MKTYSGTYLVLFGIMLITICGGAFAVEIPPMPELKTFYTEVAIAHGGAPNCLLVVPPGDEYARIGTKIAAAVKQVSGADLAIQDASKIPVTTLQSSNAILVGYFANNPLVEFIYDEHYISLDKRWPGDGGYVVRTVHDPLGKGTSFVYIGGADLATATAAADYFISTLPEHGDISYPHTVKVVLPGGLDPYKSNPETIQARIDAAKGKNFRAVAGAVNGAAVGYYLTGNPDNVEIFKGIVPILAQIVAKMKTIGDARGGFHIFNMWDNMEEAPGFSDEDRRSITEFLWMFANKFRDANKEAVMPTRPVGNDWDSRVTWDIARYFKKYYDLDVAGLLSWADARFQGKAKFWRSYEDCPGYGGMTIYDTFYYALPAHYDEWFDSEMARKACDYGLAVINNLGGAAGFGDTSGMYRAGYWPNQFLAAAWKYRDGRYLWMCNRTAAPGRANFSYNSYVQDVVEPELPKDLLGVYVIPLPDWVYDGRTAVLGTAPSEMNPILNADPTPPREECFDKVTFRTSFERQDQYLILGGISHGYHAHPDGNSIIEYTDKGDYRIFDHGYFVPDTPEHNTLVVYRDGMFAPGPRLTGFAHLGDFFQLGMTQTYLNSYNGVNWRRNIIWNKENYFLVIDDVEAEQQGNFGLNIIYRVLSDDRPQVTGDRICAVNSGRPLNLVSASETPFKLTTTTPYAANRHAIIEAKAVDMAPGDRQYFINLFHTGDAVGDWPYEIVPATDGAVMIKAPDGYAFAGVGKTQPAADLALDAAVFYVGEKSFVLTAGKQLKSGEQTWFAATEPVNIELNIADKVTGIIEVKQQTSVMIAAKADVMLGGEMAQLELGESPPGTVRMVVPEGRHDLSFTPSVKALNATGWRDTYAGLEKQHRQKVAALADEAGAGKQMAAAWKNETYTTKTVTSWVNAAGAEVKNLTEMGTARYWTEGSKSTNMKYAVDGNPESYSASGAADPRLLPKDFGMEWDAPVPVGCFEIDYYNKSYGPTDEGQQLQAWDGEDWYPIDAKITKDETGGKWVYIFDPVETTRVRIFITEFDSARTAVREMRIFTEPATRKEDEVKVPLQTNSLAALDIDGDGKVEVLAAVNRFVKCFKHDGTLLWEQELPKTAMAIDAYDLDNDGKGEVVVGCKDHKLYCYDFAGNQRWAVLTPADPYFPEIEPATGEVKQVKCADIDGDGDGEIVIGSSNWFAYAYDHEGNKLWGTLNWAHQPTAIAFPQMGEGKLAALISTTYNDANVFSPEGKKIHSVSVGYHGAAMSVAAGDMDGNGKDELLVGSRVGGFHCNELGSKKAWAKFMGAEVSQVAVADLTGDGKLEAIAGSKNFHLLVTDADGEVLWAKNVGEAILDFVVADVNADGTPEIIVATEGGMVRVVDAGGNIVATFSTGGNVTKIIAADLNGDGKIQIAAGCDDGFVYGDIK